MRQQRLYQGIGQVFFCSHSSGSAVIMRVPGVIGDTEGARSLDDGRLNEVVRDLVEGQ